jgi:hypothetical protein
VTFINNLRRWLWVPAFAGTTKNPDDGRMDAHCR